MKINFEFQTTIIHSKVTKRTNRKQLSNLNENPRFVIISIRSYNIYTNNFFLENIATNKKNPSRTISKEKLSQENKEESVSLQKKTKERTISLELPLQNQGKEMLRRLSACVNEKIINFTALTNQNLSKNIVVADNCSSSDQNSISNFDDSKDDRNFEFDSEVVGEGYTIQFKGHN